MKISIFGLSGLFYHQDRGHFFIFSRALFDLNWLLFADQNKAHFRYQGGDFQDMSRGFRIGPSFFKRSRLTFYLFYGHFYQSRLSSLLSVISPTFWLFQDFNNFSHFRRVPIFTFSTTLFNQISNPLHQNQNQPHSLQKIKIVVTFKQDQAFLPIKTKTHPLTTTTPTPLKSTL